MAANIFTGATNSNWGTNTNWSLSTVPTASDGHVATFNASSPNCSINSSGRVCNAIDFTGYTNTITKSQTLAIFGDMTLSATMTFAGTNTISIVANSNVTTNGKALTNTFQFGNNGGMTVNFLDLFNASTINYVNSGSITFAGSFGFSCSTLSCTVASKVINYAASITYTVTTATTLTGTGMSFNSTSPGALFNLSIGATQSVINCSATWINSSGGQTILPTGTYTLNNTSNWGLPNSTGNMFLMW